MENLIKLLPGHGAYPAGKEIDHIEHVVAYEKGIFAYTEHARGFTIVYKDGTKRDFKYHEPHDEKLMEMLRKQGRLKLLEVRYDTVEELLDVLISELRKDGKDWTTLASKAYKEQREKERKERKKSGK